MNNEEFRKLSLRLAKETSQLSGNIKIAVLNMIKFTNGVDPIQDDMLKKLDSITELCENVFKEMLD
jgi:hypothetical protein